MRFSIIVPVYNVAPYLRECLDSVLAQTYPNWECLCVDDGSTDDSGAILDEYAQKDSRFRVFHKKNGGVSSARNLALDNATGEWVGFLDGDDVWTPYLLTEVTQAAVPNNNVDVVGFKTKDFISHSQCFLKENIATLGPSKMSDLRTTLNSTEMTCTFAGKIYRNEIVRDIRFQYYVIGEDLLFLTQCMLKVNWQITLDYVGYGYRQRNGSASHSSICATEQLDFLRHTTDILRCFSKTTKLISPDLWRQYLNKLIETFPVRQWQLSKVEQTSLWDLWYMEVAMLANLQLASYFQRMRLQILKVMPYTWTIFFFCFIPRWLKRKGLHR